MFRILQGDLQESTVVENGPQKSMCLWQGLVCGVVMHVYVGQYMLSLSGVTKGCFLFLRPISDSDKKNKQQTQMATNGVLA